MRLAIFIFVCFAASTAVNSTQTNYSGARDEVEKLRAILSDIPRLPPNNFSLTRRFRQTDQPTWCRRLEYQTTEEVMANCKELAPAFGSRYVFRIGRNVTEEAWKKFIGNVISISRINVEIVDSSLTEVIMAGEKLSNTQLVISSNSKVKTIGIKGKEGSKQAISFYMEIKGNPALKSIKIEAQKFEGNDLIVIDNEQLEAIEFNVPVLSSVMHGNRWTISHNPKLRRIQINCETFGVRNGIHIVGNKALVELNFPEAVGRFVAAELIINDNNNLESIKIPANTEEGYFKFRVPMLEIRQNDKLKTIDLGKETRWKRTNVTVRENPLLSSETLETLKKIEWKSKDIQDVGERDLPATPVAATMETSMASSSAVETTTTSASTTAEITASIQPTTRTTTITLAPVTATEENVSSTERGEEMETSTVERTEETTRGQFTTITTTIISPTVVNQPGPVYPDKSKENKTNNTGLIIGCVAAVLVVISIGLGVFLWKRTSNKKKEKLEREKMGKKEQAQKSKREESSKREEKSKTKDTTKTEEPSKTSGSKETASSRESAPSDPV